MGDIMLIHKDDELYHYGVKGMKWGVRRYRNDDGSLTAAGRRKQAKDEYRTAKKEYNKAYNSAYKYSSHHPISQHITKKGKRESNRRWEEAYDKAEKANKAEVNYKQAKRTYKSERKAEKREATAKRKARESAEDKPILDARKAQEEAVSGMKKQAVNYSMGVLSGDKNMRQAAAKETAKLLNSYIENDATAKQVTYGEARASAILAGIGAATFVGGAIWVNS